MIVPNSLKIPKEELSNRLQILMLSRIAFVSVLLGASVFIQIRENQAYFGHIQTSHYLLIGVIYFLTIVYVLLYKYIHNLLFLAYLQLIIDTCFITAVIYCTGGIDSLFSYLYLIAIVVASILLYRRGGMAIASSSSILYGVLLDLQYYGIIHPLGSSNAQVDEHQSVFLFYHISVNIAGFYLIAFLSSYLSEQARKSRAELSIKQTNLDKLEILHENIVNSIASGLIALDDQERIILFNPAAEKILNRRSESIYGKKLKTALPFFYDVYSDFNSLKNQTGIDTPHFSDLSFSNGNGKKTVIRLSISPLISPTGNRKRHIIIFQDMTEIKKAEEDLKKVEGLALVGELAARVAHEIKNPLASISGSIQMLKDGFQEDDMSSRLMDIVDREIDRLNKLVNEFLVFARPKEMILKEIDLNQLILDSLDLYKNSPHWSSKIKIYTDLHPLIHLKTDPEQIKQVLWNLMLNAGEAMTHGGTLNIKTARISNGQRTDERRVALTIRDSGLGFDPEILPRIFTPFFTTKPNGSGLGLAIVKGIIESLNGNIKGANDPEGGAIIAIELPESQ